MPSIDDLIKFSGNPNDKDDREFLEILFNAFIIRVNKNKKITLSSNSVLRNVGRTYRWTIGGYQRERIHDTEWGQNVNYRWKYHNITKEKVVIETPNGGEINGLSFTGKADEAQDFVFSITADQCFLDILLEIELEGGRRFTEKVFFPRALATQRTGLDTIKGVGG